MFTSEIICKGAQIQPADPSPPKRFTPTWCMTCGRPLETPEQSVAWNPSSSFTDWQYLQPGPCRAVCTYCAALMTKSRLTNLSKSVVSASDGAFALVKDAHLAWFFQEPPEPPFVAMFAPQSQKRPIHMFWRATPTLHRNLIHVQFSGTSLTIRRPVLEKAVVQAEKAAFLARDNGIRLTAHHPFESLTRKLNAINHGTIRANIELLACKNHELQEILTFLKTLTTGELWAMSVLCKANPEAPLREPVIIH